MYMYIYIYMHTNMSCIYIYICIYIIHKCTERDLNMAKHGLMPWELHLLQQFASIGIMIWVSESLSHIAHRGFLKFANALIH